MQHYSAFTHLSQLVSSGAPGSPQQGAPAYPQREHLPIHSGSTCLSAAGAPAYPQRAHLPIRSGGTCLSTAKAPTYLQRGHLPIRSGGTCLSTAKAPVYPQRGHLPIHTCTAWRACHDDDNNISDSLIYKMTQKKVDHHAVCEYNWH